MNKPKNRAISDRIYREKNKDRLAARRKVYYEKNREKILLEVKKWREDNPDRVLAWRAENRVYRTEYNKKYQKENRRRLQDYKNLRSKNVPAFKLQKVLRARMLTALKREQKKGSAIKDLGCSVAELKLYLESKFQAGMTWENHGLYGWHIDHVKPLSSFDLTDREQFIKAVHHTNLQPLWSQKNWSKGAR